MRQLRIKIVAVGLVVLSVLLGSGGAAARPAGARPSKIARSKVVAIVRHLKEVNYYPSSDGWSYMWTRFHRKTFDRDFARIHALGANTVRIIVQPDAVGYPRVKPVMARRFSEVIAMAARHSLRVHLTLFDLWAKPSDVGGSKRWVRSLLSRYRGDRRIVLVELHNEVNPADPGAITWIRVMLPFLSKVLPGTPRTISTADVAPSVFASLVHELAATPPDVWDYHYYSPGADAAARFATIKALAAPRPLFIGETGQSTSGRPGDQAPHEQTQAAYFRTVFAAAAEVGLPDPAPWTLNDFSTGAIPPGRTASDPRSYGFGLFRINGTRKPAARVVAAAFIGAS